MRPSSKEVVNGETQLKIRKKQQKKVTLYLFVAKSIKAGQPGGNEILGLWTLIQIFL